MIPVPRRRLYTLALPNGRTLELGARTLVMGILNVTPDSFSDGGQHVDLSHAVDAAHAMVAAGADIIDVGGESTRPGASPVDATAERARVVPMVAALARALPVPISVDTTKAVVAAAAIDAGAMMINDISGLRYDPAVADVSARGSAALVVMHMRGVPSDMYRHAAYVNVAAEVAQELAWSIARALEAGVHRDALVVDPGLGFAKQARHSWELLAHLDDRDLLALDLPLLVGASRKSFLQVAIGECPAAERDGGSHAAAVVAALSGAHIVRVHDVPRGVQAVRVADMISAAAEAGVT